MSQLLDSLLKQNDIEALEDALWLVKDLELTNSYTVDGLQGYDQKNFRLAHNYSRKLLKKAEAIAKKEASEKSIEFWENVMLFDAPWDFDTFLRYMECEMPPSKQFYAPRKYLKPVVKSYQEIFDGKLKLLLVELVKRAGKSQLGILGTCFMSGKFPDRSTLMEGTGDDLVDSFFKGCLEYLSNDTEYRFYDVFPEAKLIQSKADLKTINLSSKSRFPTIMCRSIDARQVGLSEATNILYLDDCVEGYKEAQNKNMLEEKWRVISGDVMGRALEGTPIVACGTRYSIYDPMSKLEDEAEKNNWPYRICKLPALNEKGESNYEFFNPRINRMQFTTTFFNEQRLMLSQEQFMAEFQQEPFEAKGLVFPEDKLNRYFELPVDVSPDGIIAVCDTAEGKGDSVMMPIAYIYGTEVYIEDCVFSNALPAQTKPECARKIFANKVQEATFESNLAGKYFARDVEEMVKKLGGMCSFRTKYTTTNKATRIELASDNILKHFWFKDKSKYTPSSEYGMMIRELTAYTRMGKVKHDDAPDGLSLLENEIRSIGSRTIKIKKRSF